MPKGMSEDVSKVVVDALKRGMSRGQISGVVGVSKRAITRISSSLKKHGTAKPPPSGAKLGRPVKLTKTQAEAMIVWMAQRDHTFYVKDLVAFLRDQYRYKGCDGTVRRCLLRAGYKRKLPWHKSEMTVWTPPNYKPTFVTSISKRKRAQKSAGGMPSQSASELIVQQEDEHVAEESDEDEDGDEDCDGDAEAEAEAVKRQETGHSIRPALSQGSQGKVTSSHESSTYGAVVVRLSATGSGNSAQSLNTVQGVIQPRNHGTSRQHSNQQLPRKAGLQPRLAQAQVFEERATRSMPPEPYPTEIYSGQPFQSWQEQLQQKDDLIAQLQQQLAQKQIMANDQAVSNSPGSSQSQGSLSTSYQSVPHQQMHQPMQQMGPMSQALIDQFKPPLQAYYQWGHSGAEQPLAAQQPDPQQMHQYQQTQNRRQDGSG